MNAYHIMIQVFNSTPLIWRKIEVSNDVTFQQLHEAILVLFHWKKDREATFQIANQTLHMNSEVYQTNNPTLSTYLLEATPFTYIYGNKDEELWELSLFTKATKTDAPSLKLLDYEQEHPIYGMGGVATYQAIKKELIQLQQATTIQQLLNQLTFPFNEDEITISFENILQQNLDFTQNFDETQFNSELLNCRTLLMERSSSSPHLVLVHMLDQIYPCYIDFLENGIELMVFYDQSGYARSIQNSISEYPDLLFTNALTIDFLYEDSDASTLYLYDKRNLCFVQKAGCLPSHPNNSDFRLLTNILRQLQHALLHHELPSLTKQTMLVIQDFKAEQRPYEIHEERCMLQLSSDEKKSILELPHTNERFTINFTAVANEHSEETRNLEIHLVARGKRYTKDRIIHVENMPLLLEQLHQYFHELLYERCIPESISTTNINLMHILQPFCETLHIALQPHTPSTQYKNDLLKVLANTLNITTEELLLMEDYKKDNHSDHLSYNENLSLPTPSVTTKYLH